MKFSFRKLLAFVLPLAMVMVSCNDDDPTYSNPYLTVGNRNISFTKDGGSVTFDIDANRSWTITASDTWLVASPASDDNKTGAEKRTTVNVTATANEGGPRSAQLTISSPAMTDPIIINVAQEGEGATAIADALAMDKGAQVTLKGTVGAVTTQSFVLVDNTGAIVVFIGDEPTVAIGDKATVKGAIGEYAGLKQIDKTGVDVKKTDTDAEWNPTPEEFTAEDFTAYAENVAAKYVKMAGKLTISDSGKGYNYYNFNMTGSSAKGSFSYVPESLVEGIESGSNVVVKGYLVGINSSEFIQIAVVETTLDETAPEEPETEITTIETVTTTGEKGDIFKVEGTVAAVTTKSFVVADATGLLYVYTTPKVGGEFLAIGDVVTVEGTYDEYNNICQLKSATIQESDAAAVTLPESEEMDVEALDAYSKAPFVKRGTVEATVNVSQSGSNTYYNLAFDGTDAFTGTILYPSEEMIAKLGNGKRVVIDAYLAGFGSKRVQFVAVSVEESTAAYLAAEKSEYEIAAAGGDVEIAVNTNVDAFTAAVAGIEGAEAVVGEGKVTVTVPANTAEEGRTATVTISAEGVEDVTVTIKQEGVSAGEPVQYELVTDASTIANGDEIIFVGLIKSSDVYHVAADPNYASGTTYLKTIIVDAPTDNVITIAGEKIDVFAVEASGAFFKFKSAEQGKYLGYKGDGNYITYDAGDDVIDEWSIVAGADNAMTITLNGQDTKGNERLFQWNATNTRFSAYKSSSNQADAMIFRKVVTE